jgi:K+-transporting ATPase ATPase C chain
MRMMLATMLLLGIAYPLVVTLLAQRIFPEHANGELIVVNGRTVGSRLIGQPFTGAGYFYSRPSSAGSAGYDASNSGGSNLGPTNRQLLSRVARDVQRLQPDNPRALIPVDLVTTSGSGLDPHISQAGAEFQVPRVARERGMSEGEVRTIIKKHTEGRQFGVLGEPRVNVLELNLDLDETHPILASRLGS